MQFATEYQPGDKVKIAIVGGGATGVELSAELPANAVEQLYAYGFKNLTTDSSSGDPGGKRAPIQAGPCRSASVAPPTRELRKLGVDVRTATMITRSDRRGLHTGWGAD